ncbi:unnamed protein product [Anisakis simplex]|uniref:Pleiomorphic adenoma protein-like 2 n=1 Tax=Anisakis simplex TaxID=6269 RepID=A0A0M3JCE3_ANISI|nr:unnamed protein product [Anisakis simplex]
MDPKSMPILKSESISPQAPLSTSHPSSTYRDFLIPAATSAYQHPMHGFLTG